MNASNASVDTRYYYASEVVTNLQEAFRKAWAKETAKRYQGRCEEPIDRQNMYGSLLVPAALIITILFLSKLQAVQKVLHGSKIKRKPMGAFGSDRFSFAATFGALTYLCFEIAVKRHYVVRNANHGPFNVQILGAVVSIIVYTLDYFPLLVALADKTSLGDFLGTLYIWTMTSLYVIQRLGCYGVEGRQLVLFIQNIPIFMCMLFLSVSFPARLIASVRKQLTDRVGSSQEFSAQEVDSIRQTPQGRYVQNLLVIKPKGPPNSTTKTISENILLGYLREIFQKIRNQLTYKIIPDFRYSLRMMGVVVVGVQLIYMISAEVLLLLIPLLSNIISRIWERISLIKGVPESESVSENFTITVLFVTRDVAAAIQVCAILSALLAFCIGLLNIIHTLTSYRQYLMELYRGDNSHIPKRQNQNNTDIIVGSMQFAGYQIGFVIFAYMMQITIIFFSSFGLSLVFIVIKYKRAGPIQFVFSMIWPMVVFSILVRLLQILTAKFVFLQNNGRVMAVQHRQGYHLFLYFTFILDIIIGSMRCPYRLLKAVSVGSLTLARLDHSVLSREFETLDTGFRAYIGFLHFENVTSHPVFLTFVRLLLARPGEFETEKKLKASVKASVAEGGIHIAEIGGAFWRDNQLCRRTRAKHRWFLIYTLINNPQLQFLRRPAIG
uniref:Receptor for retinol uptake STRA6 n=1 Tax=Crassostrea virginica TaxID=6565 RepID=A0A8B8EDT2_CRAVI|nr:stimulated by retinoic acid gene 6 protein-like [Crassostrea virginica]XP_022337727.1 stimulated by retinoic acid gene 6 protein-like [Crassostrea virginica]